MGESLIKLSQKQLVKLFVLFLAVNITCVSSLLQAKEYLIGVEDIGYYPLYDFTSKDLNNESFTQELLSTFFSLHGYKIKFVALPIKRFNKWYVEDAIDFKFPDNPRWRKDKSEKLDVTYSQPVLDLIAGSYVLKKNKKMLRKDVKRLGTIYGFHPTFWFDRVQNNTLDLIEDSSSISIVKHLLRGNVEAINIDSNVINYNLKLLQQDKDAVVLNEGIMHGRFSFYFSTINYPEIIQQFDEFLTTHQEAITELKTKYGIVETSD